MGVGLMPVRLMGMFALVFVALLAACLSGTQGHLTLILDDSYIHLAMAEHLPWHMGINAGEVTDASTSILYPWLLMPFAGHAVLGVVWALLMNLAAATSSRCSST